MTDRELSANDDDIFRKFSDSARKILTHSQRIARNMGSGINSEHLLLALATTPGSLSFEILQDHMVNIDQIRLILSLRGRETALVTGISPHAKKIIDLAAQAAFEYQHSKIDPEHILLGITAYPDCLAYQIISRIGTDPKHIKEQILKLFDELERLDKAMTGPAMMEDLPEERKRAPVSSGSAKNRTKNLKQNILDYFGSDLTFAAKEKKLDPVIGRQDEIQRLIQILVRRTKNNPVLIGDPGVGKTAIVEGLAQRITSGAVPPLLKNKKIYQLDMALIVAGTTYRGQFEDRIKKIIGEIKKNPDVIIFVDELHTIVGAGAAEGSMDAANILKPALAKGEIRLIGATTLNEYRRYIEKDAALERRLQKILVPEPTLEETIAILSGIKSVYERHHHLTISPKAVKAAAVLSQRFIQDRFQPDKSIDLIDEAASALHLKRIPVDSKLSTQEAKLKKIIFAKEKAVERSDFELAAKLRQQELAAQKQLDDSPSQPPVAKEVVSEKNIAAVVTAWTGIPVGEIVKEEQERLCRLEVSVKKYVIGQDAAIKTIASTVRRAKTGISNPSKPLGSFLLLGPTGVGKTYLTQVLAKTVYGSDEALIKIDMSEFMERHNVARLVGAPPGYVGYEDAGKLTEAIRRQPFSVVLFDEIEKAHPDVFNLMLQILEDGKLTDAAGKQVSFRHALIIMTSNIGSDRLTSHASVGFRMNKPSDKSGYKAIKDDIAKDLQNHFKPEFINRLDSIVFFEPLSQGVIKKIVAKELNDLASRLASEGYLLSFSGSLKKMLADKGFDPSFGVRPLKRAITRYVEDKLADYLLSPKTAKKGKLTVDLKRGRVVVEPKLKLRRGSKTF